LTSLASRIQDLLGAAVPEITGVRIVGPTSTHRQQAAASVSPTEYGLSWTRRSTQ
jgi:hypothetical protein